MIINYNLVCVCYLCQQAIRKTLEKMPEGHLRQFKETLWRNYPQSLITSPQSMDLVDLVDRLLESFNLQGSLQIVQGLLGEMGQGQLVHNLQELCVQSMHIPFYTSVPSNRNHP